MRDTILLASQGLRSRGGGNLGSTVRAQLGLARPTHARPDRPTGGAEGLVALVAGPDLNARIQPIVKRLAQTAGHPLRGPCTRQPNPPKYHVTPFGGFAAASPPGRPPPFVEQLHSRGVFWRIHGGNSWQRNTDNPHDLMFWRIRFASASHSPAMLASSDCYGARLSAICTSSPTHRKGARGKHST